MNVRLYLWQRGTAALMLPLIAIHLAAILYAGTKGLTASDILARTRGSLAWGLFYSTFVVAASVHASIGLRNVLAEWTGMHERTRAIACIAFGLALAVLGMRAVLAVVRP